MSRPSVETEQQALVTQIITDNYNGMIKWAKTTLHNEQDAEDAAHDAFLTAWEHADKYKKGEHPKAWLATIVRNKALDMTRRRQNPTRSASSLDDDKGQFISSVLLDHDPAVNPEQTVIDDSTDPQISQTLASLYAPYKEALLLSAVYHLSAKEIATLQDVPINTANTRIYKANKKMQDLLPPSYNPVTTAIPGS